MRTWLLSCILALFSCTFAFAQGDENWDDQFGIPGTDGTVWAIAIDGDDIYVGGTFTKVGTIEANNLAKWNYATKTWTEFGDVQGTPIAHPIPYGIVNTIKVHGDEVFIGGNFFSVDGVFASHLAKWDKSTGTWSEIGGGTRGNVRAIEIDGDDIYVGGSFLKVGNLENAANGIAKWNSSSGEWALLQNGVTGNFGSVPAQVNAIIIQESDVYVGGLFTSAGSVATNHVAKWNAATNTWSPLGQGLDIAEANINALAIVGDDLYAGGSFYSVSGVNALNVAKWNFSSQTWEKLEEGVSVAANSFSVYGDDLYVSGYFESAGGQTANGVAVWNTNTHSWSTLNSGTGLLAHEVAAGDNGVYVGGTFSSANGGIAEYIAHWDGNNWSALGNAPNGRVSAMAQAGEDIVISGDFAITGAVKSNRISKWNPSNNSWRALGSGMDHSVNDVAVSGSDIYAAGRFKIAGGTAANHIAKWDGANWSALGDGTDFPVSSIAIDGQDMYACGVFGKAGGISVNGIARWDGSSWSALGGGITSPQLGLYNANAVAVDVNHQLYLGGNFKSIDGVSANNIAKWNGSAWSSLGDGLNSFVNVIATDGDKVYAGGSFTLAGGNPASRLAMWDGSTGTWSEIGGGVNSTVFDIVVQDGDLYIAGNFTEAGGMEANRVAKWNSSTNTWSTFGSGTDKSVNALVVSGKDIFFGGQFTTAGNKASFGFAHWTDMTTAINNDIKARPRDFALHRNHPNPFNPSTTISYQLPVAGNVTLTVLDRLGRQLAVLANGQQPAGQHQLRFDANGLASGVYFYRLSATSSAGQSFVQTRKLMLLK